MNEDLETQKTEDHQCEQCELQNSKYKCPGCSRRHCGIACINIHKKEQNCSGMRKVEKFISKNKYNEQDLLSDLRYLQNQINSTEKVKKKLHSLKVKCNEKNMRTKLLKEYAQKKHNIKVHILPLVYERHRNNLSFYFTKEKLLYWSLEFLFYSKGSTIVHITNPQVEISSLKSIIINLNTHNSELLNLSNPETMTKALENKDILIFMKNMIKDSDPKVEFFSLSWDLTLEQSLKNTKFYEMPTFMIVRLKDLSVFSEQYTIQEFITV